MGAAALACWVCSVQAGHVRAGRWVPAGRERRAVRCGLLLGCLVCVQVAEQLLVREPLGIEVLDLEVGQLRAQPVPQVVMAASAIWRRSRRAPPAWAAILVSSFGPKTTS